jgi:cytochrome P450
MEFLYLLAIFVSTLSAYVCYFIWQTQKFRTLSQAHGCQLPPQYPHKDPIFGLDLFIRNARMIADNRFLPDLQDRYSQFGRTFGSLSFGNASIASVEPENLRTIWVTKFEDWGVQPLRLPALIPFVGRGFISMDGPEWERSMALLKPSFRRSNIANLEPFEQCFQQFLGQLPKDGSTVDLQPHFANLVCEILYILVLLRLLC